MMKSPIMVVLVNRQQIPTTDPNALSRTRDGNVDLYFLLYVYVYVCVCVRFVMVVGKHGGHG